ncbi:MAG: nucleotide exchange factor GrpE [Gemmatimonadales bacterium]|nr:MAG: nucleotide exchange factor GrpE [Gemmatimonadales bacterium]
MLNPWKGRQSEDGEEVEGPDPELPVEVEQDIPSDPEAVVVEDDADAEDAEMELESELDVLNDRHLRLAAEFENFRKRTQREQSEYRTMAKADLVYEVLPTLDDLARVADIPHDSTTVEALDEGIELILRNLRKKLEDAGLAPIEALDQPFDPERHQGILTVEVDDSTLDDTVSRVFVEGYTFLGRLVRPAQVEVRRFTTEPEPEIPQQASSSNDDPD